MINDMDALVNFDHQMVALRYTVDFDWHRQAQEFAARCQQHGHTNEALVGLVTELAKMDPALIFRIGREYSRVLYALSTVEIDWPTRKALAEEARCDEWGECESNWSGRFLYRFWWD